MGNKIDTNIIVDGQLAVATAPQNGTIIESGGEIDATALVQTENGPQLAVKTVSVSGGGGGGAAWGAITGNLSDQTDLKNALDDKQATLVSGTNIKTVNNTSLLGSGNISIDSLPSQTGQSGKFLTTDGTDASWGSVSAPEGTYTQENLIAGNGISITQVQQPIIDENTLAVWHFYNSFSNAVSGGTVGDFYLDGSSSSSFSSAISKFGGFSLHCNNSGNDRSIVYPNSISLGENNFTVDFWIYLTDALYSTPFWLNFKGLGDVRIYQNKFQFLVSGVVKAESENYDINSWLHFAAERSSSTLNFYLNGTKFGTATSANSLTDITLQQQAGTYVYLDEFRLSNVARYNGQNFTPFNEPYASTSSPAQYQINNTQTAPSVMIGATSGAAGTSGLVPAPAAGDQAKYLTGAGTWEQASGLQNTATGTGSLTLLGTPTSYIYTTNIGVNANSGSNFNVAVGNGVVFNNTSSRVVAVGQGVTCATNYSQANFGVAVGWSAQITSENTVAIGAQAQANAEKAMAIGKSAVASGISSIQIGEGTNSTANTVQIDTYQVFNRSTGKLVADRIPVDGTSITVSGGVLTAAGGSAPTLTWYKNNTGTTVTISDTSSANLVKVYKNGILLEPTADYSISGTTLTMVTALVATDKIAVEVF